MAAPFSSSLGKRDDFPCSVSDVGYSVDTPEQASGFRHPLLTRQLLYTPTYHQPRFNQRHRTKILSGSVTNFKMDFHPGSHRWDTETVVTANTSAHSGSFEVDLNLVGKPGAITTKNERFAMRCQRYSGSVITAIISASAFLSPIFMVLLPSFSDEWKVSECGSDCDALFISLSFKLLLLLTATWLLFVREPRANLPRIFLFRAVILAIIFLLVVSYWLFYVVRAAERRFADVEIPFQSLLSSYAVPLLENLLWIHYLAVVLIEVRHQQARFYVKVVRSPDGISKSFTLGQLSIQRAAISVLDRYYSDFPRYNPHLEDFPASLRKRSKSSAANHNSGHTSIGERGSVIGNGGNNMSGLKYYEVDGLNGNGTPGNIANNGLPSEVSGRFETHPSSSCRSHASKKREEQIDRRRRRLLSCTLSAFNRIRSADGNSSPTSSATPLEIAQAVFPSIDRSLRKYLRATKQQHLYTQEAILKHLSTVLTYGLSAHTFLEKYLSADPILDGDLKRQPLQTWDLFSDILVSRSVGDGTTIVLRQGEVSLLVTFSNLPYLNLREVVPDSKHNRFILAINSESSV